MSIRKIDKIPTDFQFQEFADFLSTGKSKPANKNKPVAIYLLRHNNYAAYRVDEMAADLKTILSYRVLFTKLLDSYTKYARIGAKIEYVNDMSADGLKRVIQDTVVDVLLDFFSDKAFAKIIAEYFDKSMYASVSKALLDLMPSNRQKFQAMRKQAYINRSKRKKDGDTKTKQGATK